VPTAAKGSFEATSATKVNVGQPVVTLCGIATLMNRVLDRQPGWHKQSLQGAAAPPDSDASDASAHPHAAEALQDAASNAVLARHSSHSPFGEVQSWPTPTETVWNEIQTVAARAWLVMEWLLTSGKSKVPELVHTIYDSVLMRSSAGSLESQWADNPAYERTGLAVVEAHVDR